jgi:hypothetical protein
MPQIDVQSADMARAPEIIEAGRRGRQTNSAQIVDPKAVGRIETVRMV